MAAPRDDMELDGMPSLGLDDIDLEMLAAGPAEVQYNEIMEKDVLQYLGLFGTAGDLAGPDGGLLPAPPPSAVGSGASAPPSNSGSAGGSGPGSHGGSGIGSQLLLGGGSGIGASLLLGGGSAIGNSLFLGGGSAVGSQLLLGAGGSSAVGSAAQHVEALLAGTHPSMRGGNLADWLAADGPIVSMTISGLPEGPPAAGAAPELLNVQLLDPSAAAAVAAHAAGGSVGPHSPVASPQQQAVPLHLQTSQLHQQGSSGPAGTAVPLQQQLQFAQPSRAAQQAPMVLQLPGGQPFMHPAFFAPQGQLQAAGPPGGWMQQAQPSVNMPYFPPQQQLSGQLSYGAPQQQPMHPQASGQLPPQPDAAMQRMLAEAMMTQSLSATNSGGAPSPLQQQLSIGTAVAGRQASEQLPVLSAADLPLVTPGQSPALPTSSLRAALTTSSQEEEEVLPSGDGGQRGSQPSNKRFSDRQKAKISNLEAELSKLQESMAQVKLENERLKSKNLEVEMKLRTQEQLEQLAAVASSAAVVEDGRSAGVDVPARAPPLGTAVGLSPPNSQRKLLAHLSVSMRPADREMRAVAQLTWPRLQEWYAELMARLGKVLAQAGPAASPEADQQAKEAFKSGRYWDVLVMISRPDLSAKLMHEDMSAGLPEADVAAAAAAAQAAGPRPDPPDSWPAAAVEAMQLLQQQRGALAAAWQRHREAAEQRAARKQELLTAIRSGFLQPLQRAAPEDVELGKPLAAQGLEAMEALRTVVRQDHVSAVQIACGMRKLLSPMQQARLAAAAWPYYPYPSKWAPLLAQERKQ